MVADELVASCGSRTKWHITLLVLTILRVSRRTDVTISSERIQCDG